MDGALRQAQDKIFFAKPAGLDLAAQATSTLDLLCFLFLQL